MPPPPPQPNSQDLESMSTCELVREETHSRTQTLFRLNSFFFSILLSNLPRKMPPQFVYIFFFKNLLSSEEDGTRERCTLVALKRFAPNQRLACSPPHRVALLGGRRSRIALLTATAPRTGGGGECAPRGARLCRLLP